MKAELGSNKRWPCSLPLRSAGSVPPKKRLNECSPSTGSILLPAVHCSFSSAATQRVAVVHSVQCRGLFWSRGSPVMHPVLLRSNQHIRVRASVTNILFYSQPSSLLNRHRRDPVLCGVSTPLQRMHVTSCDPADAQAQTLQLGSGGRRGRIVPQGSTRQG